MAAQSHKSSPERVEGAEGAELKGVRGGEEASTG